MLCTSSALNVQHAAMSSMNLEKDYAITSAATKQTYTQNFKLQALR